MNIYNWYKYFVVVANVSDEEMQEHYDNFFEDVFVECEDKYGEIEEMNVCDNLGDHLVGNVYIKFRREEDAERAVNDLNNRWFGGRPVYAELSPVTDFREACCRQYEMGYLYLILSFLLLIGNFFSNNWHILLNTTFDTVLESVRVPGFVTSCTWSRSHENYDVIYTVERKVAKAAQDHVHGLVVVIASEDHAPAIEDPDLKIVEKVETIRVEMDDLGGINYNFQL